MAGALRWGCGGGGGREEAVEGAVPLKVLETRKDLSTFCAKMLKTVPPFPTSILLFCFPCFLAGLLSSINFQTALPIS